jgi:adenosylcobinamide-GDP ribazoletransferase
VLLGLAVWVDDDLRWTFVANAGLALVAALLASGLLVYRSIRRFGGVTGDVLGAAGETAFTTFVLVIAAR